MGKARRTPRRPGLDDMRYRNMREQLKQRQDPCHLCGWPINLQLRYPHPLSWSCDHVIPRSTLSPDDPRNWHIDNARAAHFRCNTARGAKPLPANAHPALNTSIEW